MAKTLLAYSLSGISISMASTTNPNAQKPLSLRAFHPTNPFLLSKSPSFTRSLHQSNLSKRLAFSSPSPPISSQNPSRSPLTAGSTRTIATLSPIALSSKRIPFKIYPLSLKPNPLSTAAVVGPLSFATIGDGRSPGSMGLPIAAFAARRLDIYSQVLLIRILLSLFPNIPWDKQPMSAIKNLCDRFLSLCRGILPPLFNHLDVSPIFAFLLLGMVRQRVRPPRSY